MTMRAENLFFRAILRLWRDANLLRQRVTQSVEAVSRRALQTANRRSNA
jgi:hypothetical protein